MDRQALRTRMYIDKRFYKSGYVLFSFLSAEIESMEFRNVKIDSLINNREEF